MRALVTLAHRYAEPPLSLLFNPSNRSAACARAAAWYAWSWRRYTAARAAGYEESVACGGCNGCHLWSVAVQEFEAQEPEPVCIRTS